MTNPYYNHENPFMPGTLVRSEEANDQLDAVEVGFDRIAGIQPQVMGAVMTAIQPQIAAATTHVGNTAPLNPTPGKQWYNTANKQLQTWSGSAWTPAIPAFLGGANLAFPPQVPPGGFTSGNMVLHNGGPNSIIGIAWSGLANGMAQPGDLILYDGNNWHLIPGQKTLDTYLPLYGGVMVDGSTIAFDGAGGTIENVVIDCGYY